MEKKSNKFTEDIENNILIKIGNFLKTKTKIELIMLSKKQIASEIGISVVSLDKYLLKIIENVSELQEDLIINTKNDHVVKNNLVLSEENQIAQTLLELITLNKDISPENIARVSNLNIFSINKYLKELENTLNFPQNIRYDNIEVLKFNIKESIEKWNEVTFIYGDIGSGKTTFCQYILNCLPINSRICIISKHKEMKTIHNNFNYFHLNRGASDGLKKDSLELFSVIQRMNFNFVIIEDLNYHEITSIFASGKIHNSLNPIKFIFSINTQTMTELLVSESYVGRFIDTPLKNIYNVQKNIKPNEFNSMVTNQSVKDIDLNPNLIKNLFDSKYLNIMGE